MITRQIKTMSWEKPYVSPEIKTLEIKSEGMLCVSSLMRALDWEKGETNWFEDEV